MNIMKLYYLLITSIVALTCTCLVSCGNSNKTSSYSEGEKQTDAEEIKVEEEKPEPELLETSFSFLAHIPLGNSFSKYRIAGKVETLLHKANRRGWSWTYDEDYYHSYNIKINYDDGSVSGICYAQVTPEDSTGTFTINVDTIKCNGIWKSRSVKRGKNYIEAYEIQLDCEDAVSPYHISIYTTEKFDFAYVGWGEDQDGTAYCNFSDGKNESRYEISDVEHSWK